MEQRTRLFLASCIGLITTGMVLVIRGEIGDQLETVYGLTHEQFGFVSTMAFYGVAGSVLVVSPLLDLFGMRNLLYLGFVFHIAGILTFINAPNYTVLYLSMLAAGIGNGLVEVVINPLCASTFPEEKTRKLNMLHAWWPGGLIIGGILAVVMGKMGWEWQTQMGIVLVPVFLYGLLIFGQKFPVTERVEAGVSHGEMIRELLRPMDRIRPAQHRQHVGDHGAGLRQRHHVCAALFRWSAGEADFADRHHVGIRHRQRPRPLPAEQRHLRRFRLCRGHHFLRRRLFHVAHHARHHVGALSPGWRMVAGLDGLCR